MTAGVIILAVLGGAWAFGAAYLDIVDPGSTGPGPRYADVRATEVVGHALLVALAALLCAGLARRSDDRGTGQVVGGLLLLATTLLGRYISDGLFFFDQEEVCVVDGCWIVPVQSVGLAIPAVLTVVALVLVGLKAYRLAPAVRLLLPPGVFLLATAVQHLTWTSTMFPFLMGGLPR